MKKITKILSIVMAVVMLFCATPIAGLDMPWSIDANANYGGYYTESDIYTYEITDGEVTITGCDTTGKEFFDYLGAVMIPSTIEGYPVTKIEEYAFLSCDKINMIVISENISDISSSAFEGCRNLTRISVDENNPCFSSDSNDVLFNKDKTKLIKYPHGKQDKSYEIPNTVTTIGYRSLVFCGYLNSITIPESTLQIEDYSFARCDMLNSIEVDGNNPAYSSENGVLFNKNKTKLLRYPLAYPATTYTVPNGVESIGEDAFLDCDELTSVILPDSITRIGDSAFSWCLDLDTINIPDGVTYIGKWAFYNTAITTVTIPDSVKEIAYGAFLEGRLTSVTLGNGIENIGEYAFGECRKISDVYYNGTEAEWNEISIGEGNEYLTNATIHFNDEGETSEKLLTYEIENGEVTITGCDEDASGEIVIPSTIEGFPVTGIGNDAFSGCVGLTSITIPETITDMALYAFSGCKVSAFIVDENSLNYCNDEYGVLYNSDKTELIQYPAGNTRTSFMIPDSVTQIGFNSFNGCTNLTSITIPDSVTSIGYYAFDSFTNLTSVYYYGDIESWCGITFWGSGSNPMYRECATKFYINDTLVEEITVPDTVTEIKDYAFYGFECVTSVELPTSVTNIGDSAFHDCTNLASITIPDSITSISDYTFYRCTSLTSITIPDSVTNIGKAAFAICTNLTSITIPDGITDIGWYTFGDCTNLTSIVIPDSVTSIDERAFDCCTNLTDVYFDGTKAEWDAISIGEGNEYLTGANIHYGAEPTPTLSEINFEQNNYTVNYKGSLKVVATPNVETGKKINYVIGDSTVATIDDEGNITTVGPGTATVVATIEGTDISDTCTITVSYTWWQWIIMILLFGWIWY